MRLKRLEILGFKSFADKTKLVFDPGITAVVGPNGCGKSNIADAFRWVMGEQSAKSMRGSKMPDVIFAGTTHRKPLNFAEVTITLTDIDGQLPIDYEEVSITRRLHRSGESEYFINRHPVRLKDVQSLFLDSGMGKDAYSIFEQGEIDRVINLPPLERRYIFEEAAGILRFLQRKKEALRKLEQTDLNVARIKDIHQEVERQIIVLEEQAEKARQYQDNKRLLEEFEKASFIFKWDAIETKLKDAKSKATAQDKHIDSANSQINTLKSQHIEAKQALADAEKVLRQRGEEVFKVRSAKEIKSKEKQSNEERIKELAVKEKRWRHELESMEEKYNSRVEERKVIKQTQKELEKNLNDLDKSIKKQLETVKTLENNLAKQKHQHQIDQKEWLRLLQIENQYESEIKQASVRVENANERFGRMQERKKLLSKSIDDLKAQINEKKHQFDEASKALDAQKSLFASMENDLKSISEEMEKTQDAIDRVNLEISESKARQKALQRLRADMEGFSAGGKSLLQEASNAKSPLYKKLKALYEYFTPQKGSEAALAAVMRNYSQTLAVESEKDFNIVINYIKQNKIKDVSLICLEIVAKMKSQKPSSRKNSAAMVSLALSVIENELSNHFLQGIYINKDPQSILETIKDAIGIEIWTDGAYIDRRSVVFFAGNSENNVFLREAELKSLEKKLATNEAEKTQLDHVYNAILQKRNQLQGERAELDKTIRRAEMRLVELNFAVTKAVSDMEKLRHEETLIVSELQAISKTIAEFSSSLEELRKQHAKAKKVAQIAQEKNEEQNCNLEKLTSTMKSEENVLREKERKQQQIIEESRKQSHALHVLEVKDLECEQQAKRMKEEIEMGRLTQSQLTLKGHEVNKILQEVEISLANVISASQELEQEVARRKNALEQLETKINDKNNALKKHEIDRNQVGIQFAQLESHQQALGNELLERYRLTIDAARKECGQMDKTHDQIDKQMRVLRQQIESAGNINMTSIEECNKHKTRYDFLNQQIDDLNVSKQELVEIITQLDGESRKIFLNTFEKISTNFKKNFQILFNGGEADLQFTESADVLEAGIEIIAKPPGKQMRSINLLSGGEKCLTAMALLFAIFEVRPAPFCILDEIDAPLDDTNVERFVNIVQQFVDRCQFIIITHNKRTMAIADVLFGISMEERGVSKLLCMDFAKHADPVLSS